jgi:hypothetical protein|tara:strand:+ start:1661 stop:2044 length:384 start_codon:yes stop_codon:yes gene_type:complete
VNWVYRHFPLAFHNPLVQKEAEAKECANELGGNDIFWKYDDLIYECTNFNGNGLPVTSLAQLAQEIGLDAEIQSVWKVEDILNEYKKTYEREVKLELQELLKIFFCIIKPGKLFLNVEHTSLMNLKS